jgi:hypothetical protein
VPEAWMDRSIRHRLFGCGDHDGAQIVRLPVGVVITIGPTTGTSAMKTLFDNVASTSPTCTAIT